MSNEVVLIMGAPASGKSTQSEAFIRQDYVYLNRDTAGGKVASLVPKLEQTLAAKSNVVLDNLYPTRDSRKPFIDVCKAAGVPIRCIHVLTSIEEAQINALHRMWDRQKRCFFSAEDMKGIKDPNIFPIVVLFKYRKDLEPPTMAEGFSAIQTVKFTRQAKPGYNNRALILDYDGTLRNSTGSQDYPIQPSEVEIIPGRAEKLAEYKAKGYLLLGVSNQSGIHKGILSYDDAKACFEKTNDLLGHDIDFTFCPHQSAPNNCYCRKPQSGNFVMLVEKYKLDPTRCLFVGDQTTDKTAAQRMNIPFQFAKDFFV